MHLKKGCVCVCVSGKLMANSIALSFLEPIFADAF